MCNLWKDPERALKALTDEGVALVELLRPFLNEEMFSLLPGGNENDQAGEGHNFTDKELGKLRFLVRIAVALSLTDSNDIAKTWLISPCPQLDERSPAWVVCNEWPGSWQNCQDMVMAAARVFIESSSNH